MGGGLLAMGGVGAALALAIDALLFCLHYRCHWHCSHYYSRHPRHCCRLQGGVFRCERVVLATTAAASMFPAIPARACRDGGDV
jgi:hypothetical protein